MFAISAAAVIATDYLRSFVDFPPRQKPGSFSTEAIMRKLETARSGNR